MFDRNTITTPTFGPGGNGAWFKQEGGKSTTQAPGWLKSKGLDAYEYEAGKGINRRLNGDLGVVFAVALGVQTCRKSLLIPNGAKDRSCA